MKKLTIKGAREHNLKNIDLSLPRDQFIVMTGVSGSGKSSLAFDTIFAEGQRRYLESLSSYARQFLGQMQKPEVDHIEGLSPCIAIDQKTATHNPRSTVGTVTEIHDYLRLLYSKIGIAYCPICQKKIVPLTIDEIVERVLDLGSKFPKAEILSPVVRERKGEYLSYLNEMFQRGYSKAYIDGKKQSLIDFRDQKLAKNKKHSIDIIVDNVKLHSDEMSRIFESVEKALKLSNGLVKIRSGAKEITFNENFSCEDHEVEFPPLEPRLFSFNSPAGACETCEGLGSKKEIDVDVVVPDRTKTIAEGGILPWSYKKNNYIGTVMRGVMNYFDISENTRIQDMNENDLEVLLSGHRRTQETIKIKYHFKSGNGYFNVTWKGVIPFLQDRYRKTDSDAVRRDIEQYMSQKPCPKCKGARLNDISLQVKIGGKDIHEVSKMSVIYSIDFFKNLKLGSRELLIAKRILKEIQDRLSFLKNVGLGYLTLHRSAYTLSGGEMQRIRLASQIGSQLMGVLYVLDEPSIGLHARDNTKLLKTLKKLKDLGNTLIVIEHDEETMRSADYLVDIGPGAGRLGGQIVAHGTPREVLKNKKSLTAKYLNGDLKIEVPENRRPIKNKKSLIVKGAREHNLKNIDVEFPLRVLNVVTGVSGSGKSTLVEDILYKTLSSQIMRSLHKPGKCEKILGMEYLDKVIMINQSPIGRTPRSNPATYCGFFTPIRALFASTPEAKVRGYAPGRFSFNVDGGRCDNCKGDGYLKIEMQFMPDVYLPCDVCRGKRYNRETLQVFYKGKTISDILEMTIKDACVFFENYPEILNKLAVLDEVGLGYIQLGQRATILSGGEAQRIKLASELSKRATGNTLYILDEPTTGLHFQDIQKLLNVLQRLVELGNTIVVIEHNMDVIKCADHIIDLGPEGGEKGGTVLALGTPEEIVKQAKKSHTGQYLKPYIK